MPEFEHCQDAECRLQGAKHAHPVQDTDLNVERWRGIGKLVEECGEVLQLLGKAIAFPHGAHPDGQGPIRSRLPAELADLKAAIDYFESANDLRQDTERQAVKRGKFEKWGLTGVHDLRAKAYGK